MFLQMDVTEGMPDLGVTSYMTDADGNVVFDPNTPKERMKATVTGAKTQTRKESVVKMLEMEMTEEVKESDEGKDKGSLADMAAVEPNVSDSNQREEEEEEKEEDFCDQSEASEEEQEAETHSETA